MPPSDLARSMVAELSSDGLLANAYVHAVDGTFHELPPTSRHLRIDADRARDLVEATVSDHESLLADAGEESTFGLAVRTSTRPVARSSWWSRPTDPMWAHDESSPLRTGESPFSSSARKFRVTESLLEPTEKLSCNHSESDSKRLDCQSNHSLRSRIYWNSRSRNLSTHSRSRIATTRSCSPQHSARRRCRRERSHRWATTGARCHGRGARQANRRSVPEARSDGYQPRRLPCGQRRESHRRPTGRRCVERAPGGGGNGSWNRISKVRSVLGALLPARAPGNDWIALSSSVRTDLDYFTDLVEYVDDGSCNEAIGILAEALDLVQGPPFDAPGFDWAHRLQHHQRACELIESTAIRLVRSCLLDAGAIDTARRGRRRTRSRRCQ